MKINLTLTNEEIQAVNESVLETTTDLSTIDITEPTSELMKNGDVIDTGAIKIARIENQVTIDIESKFVFWCLKFATKIGKICKFVYEMFSDLFEDLSDGYFKDEVEHYNVLEEKEGEEIAVKKEDILAAFEKMRFYIKEAKAGLAREDVRSYILNEFAQMKAYMLQNKSHHWTEAIEFIDMINDKITKRSEVDPSLWEELWTNIGNFILDHKD